MAFVQRVEKTGPKGGTYHVNQVSIDMKKDLGEIMKEVFAANTAAKSIADTGIVVKIGSKEFYPNVVEQGITNKAGEPVMTKEGTQAIAKNWVLNESVEKGKNGASIWINDTAKGREIKDVANVLASKKEGHDHAYIEVNLWTKNEALKSALESGEKIKFGGGSFSPAGPKAKDVDEVKVGAQKVEGPKNDGPDMA